MTQFLLFLSALALGIVLRAAYFLCKLPAKLSRLKAMHYILDAVWCAAAFVSFIALTLWLHDGKFEAFMLLGLCAGLAACSAVFNLFKKDAPPPQPENENSSPQPKSKTKKPPKLRAKIPRIK
ncbi:MAG: hypothetical protein FWH03_02320 [Firmicutes bacterium]|nr:hypothetical protein [Bacillota bacterium]